MGAPKPLASLAPGASLAPAGQRSRQGVPQQGQVAVTQQDDAEEMVSGRLPRRQQAATQLGRNDQTAGGLSGQQEGCAVRACQTLPRLNCSRKHVAPCTSLLPMMPGLHVLLQPGSGRCMGPGGTLKWSSNGPGLPSPSSTASS